MNDRDNTVNSGYTQYNYDAIEQYLLFWWLLSFLWIDSCSQKRGFPAVNFFLIVSWQLQMFLILIHVSDNHINLNQ